MATKLFSVLVQLTRALEALHEAAATGGSSTTIGDSQLPTLGWTADEFKGGTAFLIRDAGGAGAAPENESRLISGNDSNGTITVATAFSAGVAAGDWYGAAHNRYPRGLLVSKVNEALQDFGDTPTLDTTLTTASDQREYNLPVAAKRDLRQVWLARRTSDPWDWEAQLSPRAEWTAGNAAGKLIFPAQPRAGYKIKLVYLAPHPVIQADSDVINDYLAADWLALAAAVKAVRFRLDQPGSDEKKQTQLLNDLLVREERKRKWRRVDWPAAFPRLVENRD